MKDEDKTKAELIKELKTLRKEREKGVFKDITDYKKAEEKLEQSEKRQRSISKLSSDYFYSLKVESSGQMDIEWISEEFERVTTYHPGEIKNFAKWMSHIHPDDIPGLRKNTKTLLANNFVISEYRLFTKNGETRWFSDCLQPEWDGEQERISRVYGAVRDITKRKQAEENIKKAKDELQMIMDSVPAMIYYKDTDGRIIRANKKLADSLKMPVKNNKQNHRGAFF